MAIPRVKYCLIEEAKVDKRIVGSAVGLISVPGCIPPNILFASVAGRILDINQSAAGFEHYYLLMAAILRVGMVFIPHTFPTPGTAEEYTTARFSRISTRQSY
ncbi:MAG: hypothetical protein P8J17_02115 [Halioglobus sp.]|nr:hypothetical protein [Halioglobus sp.]